jgi:hypothetical protein
MDCSSVSASIERASPHWVQHERTPRSPGARPHHQPCPSGAAGRFTRVADGSSVRSTKKKPVRVLAGGARPPASPSPASDRELERQPILTGDQPVKPRRQPLVVGRLSDQPIGSPPPASTIPPAATWICIQPSGPSPQFRSSLPSPSSFPLVYRFFSFVLRSIEAVTR